MRNKKSTKTLRSINLDTDVVNKTLKIAKKESRNFSSMVNFVLKNHIAKESKKLK